MIQIKKYFERKVYVLCLILGLNLLLNSCGGDSQVSAIPQIYVDVEYVTILTSEDMNEGWPVAVALVRSEDSNVVVELSSLSASDWFQKQQQFQNDYPDLVVDLWEVVPGQSITSYVGEGYDLSGFFFANYRNTNPNRLRLNVGGSILLKMERETFSIEQEETESSGWWLWPW